MPTYPKRLIEVDLPIKRISAHARREKSIRHGHISTLHIWWARRPLAACRAVLCAALWPDPADPLCPPAFRTAAATRLQAFAQAAITKRDLAESGSPETFRRWRQLAAEGARLDPLAGDGPASLRAALFDFIADFANWDNSTSKDYLETARALTQAAHEALGGAPGTRPLVVDPFAGGGAIPLEALRVGADAFASDLNPVAVLLNKVVLEYIPKYGNARMEFKNDQGETIVLNGLAEAVRYWGQWIKEQAEKELAEFYPPDPDGATPIAYLWARTIFCEGPGCGVEVPLMRSLWLAKKGERSVALRLAPDNTRGRVDFQIIEKRLGKWRLQGDPQAEIKNPQFDGTVKRGSATCPVCGYTTPVARVRAQLKERRGGAHDARLFCVVTTRPAEQGRFYRLPTTRDLEAVQKAAAELARRQAAHTGPLSLVPDEALDIRGIRHTWAMIYGLDRWGSYFTPRQALALTTLVRLVTGLGGLTTSTVQAEAQAIQTVLALAVDRQAESTSAMSRWHTTGEKNTGTFGRQAIGMIWDFSEVAPFAGATGGFQGAIDWIKKVCEAGDAAKLQPGQIEHASATGSPLADDSAQAIVTDPPYYDSVPYAHLSDFFYAWLRRSLFNLNLEAFRENAVPKDAEIVVDRPHELSNSTHDIAYYERELTRAFGEGRRILAADGIGTIVFASKTTSSWEAILQAVVDAGWVITGSWPIDTEMEARVAAQGQARLASSVHLVCRPRPDAEHAQFSDSPISHIGDWRDVLAELPIRIREWMPRLASEGVVGADAIFACLGPALEVFSRYARVEKADGTVIALREYLEHVWAAVGREALNQIFAGADPTGFEEDARLTVLWLWTLNAGADSGVAEAEGGDEEADDEDEAGGPAAAGGLTLEYDTARKLAQGIGAHLETLGQVVRVKGDKAWLLGMDDRRRTLLDGGPARAEAPAPPEPERKRRKAGGAQLPLAEMADALGPAAVREPAAEYATAKVAVGATALDRIHQAMLLFGDGRGEALKRLLVEDGAGQDQRFWRLAQVLSALYPAASQEKRWVDGVLARKKGLGL